MEVRMVVWLSWLDESMEEVGDVCVSVGLRNWFGGVVEWSGCCRAPMPQKDANGLAFILDRVTASHRRSYVVLPQ